MSDSESESKPNPFGFIPPGDEKAVQAEDAFRRFRDETGIGSASPAPGSQPLGSPFPSEEGSQGLGGFVPKAGVMGEDGGVDGLPQGQKHYRETDDGDEGVAKASQLDEPFLYKGEFDNADLDDTSSVFESAISSIGSSSSDDSTLTLFNIRMARRSGGGGGGFTPPEFSPVEETTISKNIADNILPEEPAPASDESAPLGMSIGSIINDEIGQVDDRLINDLESIRRVSIRAGGIFCRSLVTAGSIIYRILEFATRSKLNMIIVLSICGAAYKNCPYAAYIFDFLISKSLPAIRWFGQITGFTDGVIAFFSWLGEITGISALLGLIPQLVELLQGLKDMIPNIAGAANDLASAAGAGIARDELARQVTERLIAQNSELIGILQTPAPQSLINTIMGGAAEGLSRAGVTTGLQLLVHGAINAAQRAGTINLLQNGAGRKKRRRTMRQKKRNQTKRRVKHGKRRQTKKRQNKRTKSRSKQ